MTPKSTIRARKKTSKEFKTHERRDWGSVQESEGRPYRKLGLRHTVRVSRGGINYAWNVKPIMVYREEKRYGKGLARQQKLFMIDVMIISRS